MHAYIAATVALRNDNGKTIMIGHPSLLFAGNEDEALGVVTRTSLEKYPPSEGWHSHASSVSRLATFKLEPRQIGILLSEIKGMIPD